MKSFFITAIVALTFGSFGAIFALYLSQEAPISEDTQNVSGEPLSKIDVVPDNPQSSSLDLKKAKSQEDF